MEQEKAKNKTEYNETHLTWCVQEVGYLVSYQTMHLSLIVFFFLFFLKKEQITLTCRVIAFNSSPVGRRPNVVIFRSGENLRLSERQKDKLHSFNF